MQKLLIKQRYEHNLLAGCAVESEKLIFFFFQLPRYPSFLFAECFFPIRFEYVCVLKHGRLIHI